MCVKVICVFAARVGFDTCRPVIVTEPLRGFGKQRRRTAACQEEEEEEKERGWVGGWGRWGGAFLTVSFFLDDVSGFLETASLTRRRHSAAPSRLRRMRHFGKQ